MYRYQTDSDTSKKKQIVAEIEKQTKKVTRSRELLLDGDIEAADFKAIKMEWENSICRLEAKLTEMSTQPLIRTRIENDIDKVINALSEIDLRYNEVEPQQKRHMVCSLYPEKLNFDGSTYRTPRPKAVVDSILLINRELDDIKKEK